jgi:hypothetical protein
MTVSKPLGSITTLRIWSLSVEARESEATELRSSGLSTKPSDASVIAVACSRMPSRAAPRAR